MARSLAISLAASLFLVSLVSLSGCSGCGNGGAAVPCDTGIDSDGDNYGEGCPAGPDCNDLNAEVHEDCCGFDPTSQGCPCEAGIDSVVACFDGPSAVSNNPPCMKGERTCQPEGVWGACVGQVLPDEEICDGGDNDCDLEVDEGVMTACGNCLPGCDGFTVGDDPFPFPEDDPNVQVDGVGLDPNGDLVLDTSTIEDHYLWIANDAEGTVSKIDTRTGAEVGRYATVTHDATRIVDHTGGRPFPAWNQDSNGNQYADNRPSRTAIDFYGDMWVANRAHDYANLQPSLTKIKNDTTVCPDLNGNGLIDTSRDVNGTPGIQLNDPAEFFGDADECIVMTVVVGNLNGWARAVAIDAGQNIEGGQDDPGNAWVGMFNDQAFHQINGVTGALMQTVSAPGVQPYGAAIDGQGRLWAPHNCCGGSRVLGMINTTMNPAPFTSINTQPACAGLGFGSYGIVVDLEDRVWIGGWPYGCLARYNPADNTWITANITGYESTWGVRGVGIDTRGNVWAAIHQNWADGAFARIDADTGASTGVWQADGPQGNATIPVGVGVDFDGDVWTVNQETSNASRLHVDQNTGEPAPHPVTGNMVDVFPVGRLPYTYSDFTGLGLRNVTRPTGEYTIPIQGCVDLDPARWLSVDWDATTPPDTAVEIYVRVGDDLATLDQQPRFGPWTVSPADLQGPPGPVPDGRYLLLTIRLISQDNESTPIVHGFNVEWSCPGDPVD